MCRAPVDLAGVATATEMPPEAWGRDFYLCPTPPSSGDLEAGSDAAGTTTTSRSSPASSRLPGRLAAVNHFITTARRALSLSAEDKQKGAGSPAGPPSSSNGSGSWAVCERLLPDAAVQAAATALASLRLRSLLHPKELSVARQCAAWLVGAALLVVGSAALIVLLAQFMACGMIVIARLNIATGRLLGLYSGGISVQAEAGPPPYSIVGLLFVASSSATAQLLLRRHASLASLLLRLDSHAPRLLLLLSAVSAALATSILLATYVFSLCAIVGSHVQQHSRSRLAI